jgi:hypothetical protein
VNLGNEYYYRVTAVDTWGNETPIEIANEVKAIIPSQIPPGECGSPPVLVIDEPQNNELICGGTFIIEGRVLNEPDPNTGKITVVIKGTDGWIYKELEITDYNFVSTFSLNPIMDMIEKINVYSSGKCGEKSVDFSIRLDTEPPTITRISPYGLSCGLPSDLTVTLDDVSADEGKVYIDGEEAIYAGAGSFYIPNYPFIEGRNGPFVVRGIDGCGNEISGTFSVDVDTQSPIFTIDYPYEGQIICERNAIVRGTVKDPTIIGDYADKSGVFINGIRAYINYENNTYFANISFTDLYSVIYGVAVDACLNDTERTVHVITDYLPLSLHIDYNPNDPYYCDSPNIILSGEASRGVISVSANNKPCTLSGTNFSCPLTLSPGENNVRVYARSYCREVETNIRLYYTNFSLCWSKLIQSNERLVEKNVFNVSCPIDVRNSCVHKKLYNIVKDASKPIKERIFAISYLLGDISGYKNLSSIEWNYIRSSEIVNVIKDALFSDGGKTYMAEKAMWSLVRLENSKPAENLILEILSQISFYPNFYNMLERHIVDVHDGGWLGKVLTKGGFYMSPPDMEENAKSLLPYISTDSFPFDMFIELLSDPSIPIEKKESALETLNDALKARDKEEIPEDVRNELGSVISYLKEDPLLKGKALISLGLLGGYEKDLINELKYGEDIPELLFALGEGGNKEVAMELIEIINDERFDSWRRIMAGRAAYAIAMRQFFEPDSMFEILKPLVENSFPYITDVILDEWEDTVVRTEALLFASSITDSRGFSSIVNALLSSTEDIILLRKGMELSVYWGDCEGVNNIEEAKSSWNNELEVIQTYYNVITDTIAEYQKDVIWWLKEDKRCEEDCEINILKDVQNAIQIVDETLETIPEWMEFIRGDITILKADLLYFNESFTSVIGEVLFLEKEGIKELNQQVEVLKSDIQSILDNLIKYTVEELREENEKVKGQKVKLATEVQKKLLEVRELIKDIEVEIGHIEKEFDKTEREVIKISQKAGFLGFEELVERMGTLKGLINQAEETSEMINKRCNNEEDPPSFTTFSNPAGGEIPVRGYMHDEEGQLIGGFQVGIITGWDKICLGKWCISIPKIGKTTWVDTFGYFETSLSPNTHFDLLIGTWNAMTEFLSFPYIFLRSDEHSGSDANRVWHFYLPYGGGYPDYDSDGLNDNAEKRIARNYIPVYYFCPYKKELGPYEEWYPTDPKLYFVYRTYGLIYPYQNKKYKLPNKEENFYKIASSPYNNEKSYMDTHTHSWGVKSPPPPLQPEGLPLFHVLPFPNNRTLASVSGGAVSYTVLRQYKTQYYLFHDYSKFTYKACVLFVCWQNSYTHDADWEWVCPFIQTKGLPPEGGKLTKVSYHFHGEYELLDVASWMLFEKNPKRVQVFVAAKSHASYWRDGNHAYKIYAITPIGAVDSKDETCGYGYRPTGIQWLPSRFLSNIDAYSIDRYSRVIYYYVGKWGKGDAPPGPNGPSGDRDYNSFSK